MRLLLAVLVAGSVVAADGLALPAYLSDHAVLQRDRPLRLDGRAVPGAAVTLRLASATATATADAAGSWSAELPALPAGGPHQLELTSGSERVVAADLLIGDVWLCSGQSNMGVGMRDIAGAKQHLASLEGARIRLLKVRGRNSREPQAAPDPAQGPWTTCSTEAAEGFSAVAISFARNVQKGGEDVPIGLIQSNRAGTFCEAWIPREVVAAGPDGPRILVRWDWLDANRDSLTATWTTEHDAWEQAHGARFARWKRNPVSGPFQPHEPGKPAAADSPLRPGVLWNGQIAPLTGIALRGVLWYQGESNTDRAVQYRRLLAQLVGAWRAAWKDPSLPFVVAQLPEFETDACLYDWQDSGPWEVLRDSQHDVATRTPGVHLAVMLGLGERRDVHPRAKWEVGERLARAALANVYGKTIAWSGPRLAGVQREGGRLVVSLREIGQGVASIDGGPLRGFAIAGADRRFVPADAVILGPDRIALSAPGLAEPVAMRYAWDDDPVFNVVCSAGLPMGTCRSDDWPLPTQDAVEPFHRSWPPAAQ